MTGNNNAPRRPQPQRKQRKARRAVPYAPRKSRKPTPLNSGSAPQFTTLDQNMRTLSRASTKNAITPNGHSYAMCRLNPFTGGSAMYPGGGNAPVIVVDHRSFADIDFNLATSCHIRILPCAPYTALIHWGSTTATGTITNNKVTQDVYGPMTTFGADTNVAWYPLNIMPEWDTTEFAGDSSAPYNATKARVTACGFRLMFTGISQVCRGLISMSTGAYNVTTRETLANPIGQRTALDGVSTLIAANSCDSLKMDGNVIPNPCTPTTISNLMAKGASGTLQQVTEDLPFRPVAQNGALMYVDEYTTSAIATTTGVRGSVGFYDESWAPIDIFLSSCDANTNFRLEVATCVEYQVDTTSNVARFARKAPPPQPALLEKIQAATNKLPSYGDLNSIADTANRLLPMVVKGAGLAGRMASLALL